MDFRKTCSIIKVPIANLPLLNQYQRQRR